MYTTRKGACTALILFALFLIFTPNLSANANVLSLYFDLKTVTYTPSYKLGQGSAGEESALKSTLEKTLKTLEVLDTDIPVRILIPSIGLNSPIQGMGINNKGELDVPSGHTDNVGWYKDGVVPGKLGSAVLDAHVFAAFSKLKYLTPGSDVFVITQTGKKLRFVVSDSVTYALSALSPKTLFARNDAKRLNLITCAGTLTSDRSTYDKRLVVYTTFAGVEAVS